MTTEELNALVEKLDSLSSLNQTSITAAASAIRQLMSERDEAEAKLRETVAAFKTLIADCRHHLTLHRPGPLEVAETFLSKHQPPSAPNRP